MLSILECSPIPQFAVGLDHKIIAWNNACELLTGLSSKEMIGTTRQWESFYEEERPTLSDLIVDQDIDKILQLYEGKRPTRSHVVPDAWEACDFFPKLKEKGRFIYFLAAPILNNTGEIQGAVETLQDVTENTQRMLDTEQDAERLRIENLTLKSSLVERHRLGNLIGKCSAMQQVFDLIIKAAGTGANVIITGESGTGKELVARAIHDNSVRRDKKFVTVNCGAIPESLFESEFFGYKKGAFTGAQTDKKGHLDMADGGTLFLDEVGELSTNMQIKLLRTIEEGGYMPVGSSETKISDIRIIAATNRDMSEQVRNGVMREDFYYRLHVLPIHLPPLRKRKGDIRLLVDHFLLSKQTDPKPITKELRDILNGYSWPGNVRELQNVLHRFAALDELVIPESFQNQQIEGGSISEEQQKIEAQSLASAINDYEKKYLLSMLNSCRWNRNKTAEALNISRNTLFRKMKKYQLV